jgi:hypothetical protein
MEGPNMSTAIACHYNGIPAYVGHELDRLYGTRYACMPHFRHYGDAEGVHTYVVRSGDEALTVFLFRCNGRHVQVLNEGIRISREEVDTFADYVFNVFQGTDIIRFRCVEAEPGLYARPCLRIRSAQDLVLPLPATTDAYFNSLGVSTKRLLRNRQNRLHREFPGFAFRVYEREEVNEQDVHSILEFNRQRMSAVDKTPSIDADEEERIVRYVRDCGFVTTATIDGQLVAGAINYRIGRHFSARILAHDPRYDEYRLGFICAYRTVCECINHGAVANFYFGWGDDPYKFSLGAVPRPLCNVQIYRTRFSALRHAGKGLAAMFAGCKFQLRQGVLDAARRSDGSVGSKLATQLLRVARALKPRAL